MNSKAFVTGHFSQERESQSQAPQSPRNRFQPTQSTEFPTAGLTSERLHFMRVIGRGSSGVVRLGQDKATGRVLAIKETPKTRLRRTKDVLRVICEKTILAGINHPLVVDYYGTCQDAKTLYLAMEFVQGGDLYSLLSARGTLNTTETRFYAAEIAAVLTYLHSQDVVYRDLKSENVLLSRSGHIKLADFGCAKKLKFGERTFTLCGTPHAWAPEVLARSGHGFAVDWWTLGVLMHEMLTGKSPFEGEAPTAVLANIFNQPYIPPKEADKDVQHLLEGLLCKDPEHRFTSDKVRHHPFFIGVDWEEVEHMLPPYLPVVKTDLDSSNFDQFPEEQIEDGVTAEAEVFLDY